VQGHAALKVLARRAELLHMRQAINENRTVQLVLVAVLALAGGLLLLKSKGGSEPTAAAPVDPAAAAAAGTPVDPAAAAAAAAGVPVSTPAPVASASAVPANLIPGPGLPKGLLPAYRNGKGIVLLVRRAGGVDDPLVRSSVELLRENGDVKVYVTKAKGISRYAWLTQGVNVTELPALVVLRPRKLTKGTPTASVSYGFRNAESASQAVDDALYRGPDRPYHP